jgi:ribosomal protein S27AE
LESVSGHIHHSQAFLRFLSLFSAMMDSVAAKGRAAAIRVFGILPGCCREQPRRRFPMYTKGRIMGHGPGSRGPGCGVGKEQADMELWKAGTLAVENAVVNSERLCPKCGAAMAELDRQSQDGAVLIWYSCTREGCTGQWLAKRALRMCGA